MTADIRQVAAEAGVSTATVSRVLSGRGPASAEARRKVAQAAGRLHYLPNAAASSLRTDRSMIIGVLVPNLGNPVFLPFLRGVERATREHGYSVIVAETQQDPALERRQLDLLVSQRTDALIMAARPADPGQVHRLAEAGLPVVDPLALVTEAGWDTVRGTDRAIEDACQHLASLGHRSIALVIGGRAVRGASGRRWRLLETTCGSLGMGASLVPIGDSAASGVAADPEGETRHGEAMARTVTDLVTARSGPTALWSNSHVLAPLLLEGLALADVAIPGDSSFLTFGDSPWAAAYRPPINVVATDMAAVATVMTGVVLHRLGALPEAPELVVPADSYRRRGSVGPAPAR